MITARIVDTKDDAQTNEESKTKTTKKKKQL